MRWWTSDTHFGHESILGFGRGRWATIAEHDRDLVDNWNDVVGAGDEVWHLGDVAWSFDRLVEVLPTLKGRITLVAGNHDSWWPHYRRGFFADESLNSRLDLLYDDLSHLAVAAPAPTETVRICGHVHSLWPEHGRTINVGVDVNGWAPISEDDLAVKVRRLSGAS